MALALTLALAGLGGAGSSAASPNTTKGNPSTLFIGATLPMTGPGAPYGQIFGDALKAAIDRINSTGGVNGAKINFTILDDKALAGPAVLEATQLIRHNGALLIATAYNDPPLAQYKVGQRYKVPIVNGGGNDPALTNKPYLWTDASIFTNELVPMFTYAKAHGIKKIGLLAATNFTNYDIQVFHSLANKIFGGDQPLVTFDPSSTDVKTQLQQLQSDNVDAISPLASGTLALIVAKDMSQLGMKQKIVGKSDTFTPAAVNTEASWQGAWGAIPTIPIPGWLNTAIKAKEHTPANAYHTYFANIVYIFADAVKTLESKHQAVNGANINALFVQYAKAGKSFHAASGPVTFKPDGSVAFSYNIMENNNGTFKLLQKIK